MDLKNKIVHNTSRCVLMIAVLVYVRNARTKTGDRNPCHRFLFSFLLHSLRMADVLIADNNC